MKTLDQVERLKQLAAEAARDAAMPTPEDYRIHRFGKETRALLKAKFPGTDFLIASSDGFDSMYGEHPPMVELRWNDGPSRNTLDQTLRDFIERCRRDFHFETLIAHGFTCRTCGRPHVGSITDEPVACPGGGDSFDLW
jgi:hypothetical protein